MITDNGIVRIVNILSGELTHVAIGTGVAPTTSSTSLANESLRKLSTNIIDGNTIIAEGYWDETEANNVTYLNTGLFGSTGVMVSGGAINVSKNNTQSMTVSYEITVERGS